MPAVQRFIGLVRYLSNHHQYACLWTDQKPQTFFMGKLPASAPIKLERPFVATSAVRLRFKPEKGMLLADTLPRAYMEHWWTIVSFFLTRFSLAYTGQQASEVLSRKGILQKAFYGPQVFRLIEIKDLWHLLSEAFFFSFFFFFFSEKYGFFVRQSNLLIDPIANVYVRQMN